MEKGFFVVTAMVFLAVLASFASAECFMTRGESKLLCEYVPGIGCSLPESNSIWDFYCTQLGAGNGFEANPVEAQIFPVFVELA